VDDQERGGVGDGGGVDACALLQVQAADVGVAGAVDKRHKARAESKPVRGSVAPWVSHALPSVHRKREQDVARHPAPDRIPRIHKDHSSTDGRTRSIQRATTPWDTIDGLVLANRIEIPNDGAILSRIGAQVPINGTGEGHTWN